MQIKGLASPSFNAQSFSRYLEPKWVKLALLAGSLFIIGVAYSYISLRQRKSNYHFIPYTPASNGSTASRARAPVSSSTSTQSSSSVATADYSDFPSQLFVKSLRSNSVGFDVKPDQKLLSFVGAVSQKFSEKEQVKHTSYLDAKIIANGRILNTPATEYLTLGDLNKSNEFKGMEVLFLIFSKRTPEDIETLYIKLLNAYDKFKKICFFDTEVNTIEERAAALTNFQVAIHSYCDRIMRGKFTTATEPDLLTLKNIFSQIMQGQDQNSNTGKCLKYLFDKIDLASTVLQKSYDDLIQNIEEKVQILPKPEVTTRNGFKVLLAWDYWYNSLDKLAEHSDYFRAFQFIHTSSPTNTCTIDTSDIPFMDSLDKALLYLQGGEINPDDVNFYELLQAANFLQIPRLVLICEKYLIEVLKENRIVRADFTVDDLKVLQVVAPYFYRALELKGTVPVRSSDSVSADEGISADSSGIFWRSIELIRRGLFPN